MVLVVALTSVGAAASEEDGRVSAQAPIPPATSRATTTPTITGRLLRAGAWNLTSVPFVERGHSALCRRFAQAAGNIMKEVCEATLFRLGAETWSWHRGATSLSGNMAGVPVR
jgi:hypothetical protein